MRSIQFLIDLNFCRDLTAPELDALVDKFSELLDEQASSGQLDLEAATLEDYDVQFELYT